MAGCVSGCSEDEAAGVVNAEVGGGCAAGAPTTGSTGGGGSGTGSEVGGGGGGVGGAGTGTGGGGGSGGGGGGGGRGSGGEGGSTKQGGERCPHCGILCRDVHVLQLHLEDTHKTPYAIDKNDLNAQFPQVVSETNVKDERTPLFLLYYRSCATGLRILLTHPHPFLPPLSLSLIVYSSYVKMFALVLYDVSSFFSFCLLNV